MFKSADCQFKSGEYVAAVAGYQKLVENYEKVADVAEPLVDHALYQIIRSGVMMEDQGVASRAMTQILTRVKSPYFSERSHLTLGHGLNEIGRPLVEARSVFNSFVEKFHDSELIPEALLGLARTYEREGDWVNALKHYDDWVTNHPDHESKPYVEYYRALANDYVGEEELAFERMQTFLDDHDKDPLALLARNWVADYYMARSQWVKAEENYLRVFRSDPDSNNRLRLQAGLMASRCMYQRQSYRQASDFLLNELYPQAQGQAIGPGALESEAIFLLGDIATLVQNNDQENIAERLKSAIRNFSNIREEDTLWYPRARGRIGDCYLRLAASSPDELPKAIDAYGQALNFSESTVEIRSVAEIGLGRASQAAGNQSPSA